MSAHAPDEAGQPAPKSSERSAAAPALPRSWLVSELWLVFALSLGASGASALLSFIGSLTRGRDLPAQTAVLNGSFAPGRPWLDLSMQVLSLAIGIVPVFLAAHLLTRSGERLAGIGLDTGRRARDVGHGVVLAAAIGGTGLAFYLATHALGIDLTVVASALPSVWWRYPVLVASALQNAVLEETLVAGFLLHRLRGLGWNPNRALALSAVLRGSYHLYQGIGGFVGNMAMGLVFGRYFQRTNRTGALIVAHTLIDVVAFIGYAALAGHVSWLPSP